MIIYLPSLKIIESINFITLFRILLLRIIYLFVFISIQIETSTKMLTSFLIELN